MKFIGIACLSAVSLAAQSGPQPRFEVASVKLSAPGATGFGFRGGPGSKDPERLAVEGYPLMSLILTAYNRRTDEVIAPGWLTGNFGPNAVRVDVAARILPATSSTDFLLMLQNLLADRFGMIAHHEQKEVSVYDLTVAKNGPKLKAAGPPEDPAAKTPMPDGPPKMTTDNLGFPILPPGGSMAIMRDRARMRLKNETMAKLAERLSNQAGRPVRNATNLAGEFDVEFFWAADEAALADPTLPSLAQALQDQLGLKLEAKKAIVDILVIDHIEKAPTAN